MKVSVKQIIVDAREYEDGAIRLLVCFQRWHSRDWDADAPPMNAYKVKTFLFPTAASIARVQRAQIAMREIMLATRRARAARARAASHFDRK